MPESESLMHEGANIICFHGAQVSIKSTNTRVFVTKQRVATKSDEFKVESCNFKVPTNKPQPCDKVIWKQAATRVRIGGKAAVLKKNSNGECRSKENFPQGPPIIRQAQNRVKGI